METMLFTPMKLGPLEVPNRISIPPMCMYSAKSGVVQPFHIMHYGQLAASGAGLICIESTAVTPDGRITDRDLGLWSDEGEEGIRRLIAFMKDIEPGVKVIVQINHAGRKASCRAPWEAPGYVAPMDGGWRVRAPSDTPFDEFHAKPRALSFDECGELVQAFAAAAVRAERAGADGVEIHMAHGYLIHQFLSPLSNFRIDEYGGALENRLRFAREVMDAVKKAVKPEFCVGIRISATDWEPDGWLPLGAVELCKIAKTHGIHFVDVSTGGNTPHAKIPVGPGYQVPFARQIREATGMPVIACGLIKGPWQAESILREGAADMIDIGRSMLDDPHWGWHAAAALGLTKMPGLPVPKQYLRGLSVWGLLGG